MGTSNKSLDKTEKMSRAKQTEQEQGEYRKKKKNKQMVSKE